MKEGVGSTVCIVGFSHPEVVKGGFSTLASVRAKRAAVYVAHVSGRYMANPKRGIKTEETETHRPCKPNGGPLPATPLGSFFIILNSLQTMSTALIGFSGFVGQNLLAQTNFTSLYRSTNVTEIREKEFELVVCAGCEATCAAPRILTNIVAGLPAAKWLANKEPEKDRAIVESLAETLATVQTATFVLVSTIDVYGNLCGTDEDYDVSRDQTHSYGNTMHYYVVH